MGKKMKLINSIFKNRELLSSSWQWPSCTQSSKTHSFRAPIAGKSAGNSAFSDPETPESWFTTTTSESTSFLTDDNHSEEGNFETIITGIRSSERLFFEPDDCASSSVLDFSKQGKQSNEEDEEKQSNEEDEEKQSNQEDEEDEETQSIFQESVILAMNSSDPYEDFKKSMEEMVESYHGNKDWEWLQELLGWYLKLNGNGNHGFIVGAFVDLLIQLSYPKNSYDDNSQTTTSSYSSALSCLSSPLSSLCHKEIEEKQVRDNIG